MTDVHTRRQPIGRRALLVALVLTALMTVVEALAGWLSNSLSLLADAAHMFTDSAALGLSLFASWFATRPATTEKTYGYYRSEILAALANGIALWLVVIWIYARALHRLHQPMLITSLPMIIAAVAGLLVNLVSGWVLRGGRDGSLNVHAAWLNVMSDALGSVAVIVAAVMIRWYGWTTADPIASMVIGVLIAVSSWTLVAQSVNILLEGTPRHLDVSQVVKQIQSVDGVHEVHDVHLWTISTGLEAMSGHVIVDDLRRSAAILDELNRVLSRQFGISHTTLQLEPVDHACHLG